MQVKIRSRHLHNDIHMIVYIYANANFGQHPTEANGEEKLQFHRFIRIILSHDDL